MLEQATKNRRGRPWWGRLMRPPRFPFSAVGPSWIDITYVGEAALALTGSVTGARYHFGWRGACLPVDARDATGLLVREDLRVLEAQTMR